jgi:hypothetical protein
VPFGADPACHFESVELGQSEVEDDEIDAAPECPFEGLWSVGAHFDGVPLPSQCASEGLGDGRVVLGEQY